MRKVYIHWLTVGKKSLNYNGLVWSMHTKINQAHRKLFLRPIIHVTFPELIHLFLLAAAAPRSFRSVLLATPRLSSKVERRAITIILWIYFKVKKNPCYFPIILQAMVSSIWYSPFVMILLLITMVMIYMRWWSWSTAVHSSLQTNTEENSIKPGVFGRRSENRMYCPKAGVTWSFSCSQYLEMQNSSLL